MADHNPHCAAPSGDPRVVIGRYLVLVLDAVPCELGFVLAQVGQFELEVVVADEHVE